MPGKVKWPPRASEALKRLWEQGLSDSQIARRLWEDVGFSVTRNAVIGRRNRMGFRVMEKAPLRNRPPSQKTDSKRRDPFDALRDRSLLHRIRTADQRKAIAPAPVVCEFLGIETEALETHHCRFPSAGPPFAFCGQHKQEGSSFCPHHHGIVWIKPSGRRL